MRVLFLSWHLWFENICMCAAIHVHRWPPKAFKQTCPSACLFLKYVNLKAVVCLQKQRLCKEIMKTDVGTWSCWISFYSMIFLSPRHDRGACSTAQQHDRLHHWCDPHSFCGWSNVLHLPEGAMPTHEGRWGNNDQWLCGARTSLCTSWLCASSQLFVRISSWWVKSVFLTLLFGTT